MQSLIHGNFEGAAQRKVYALVGASAAIAAAVGPLIGGFITTYLSWRVAFALEAVIIAIVLSGIGLVRDAPYTGSRAVDPVGAVLSVLGMGGIVLGILVWQEGGETVGAFIVVGVVALVAVVVLATFALTTLVEEPGTAVALVVILLLSIAADLVWKRSRAAADPEAPAGLVPAE
jgi:MFS family permease